MTTLGRDSRQPRRDDDHEVFDVIAIGLGPFNLSLACLVQPIGSLRCLFLEKNRDFNWHPGMLIDQTTLQNPCLADLVSLADPTSRFSYLNYCKEAGEIYSHYINGSLFISREAYNRYCRWAVARLDNLRFDREVVALAHEPADGLYVITARDAEGRTFRHRCRKLVLGVGSVPQLPEGCEGRAEDYMHTAHYLTHKAELQTRRSVTVVGSGQSAAEVFHDLLKDAPRLGHTLNWITRSPYFFQMETTKLTLEMFSPDYIDYFYGLACAQKEATLARQDSLYKGINAGLMDEIYDLLEQGRRQGSLQAHLVTDSELRRCRRDAATGQYALRFWKRGQQAYYEHRTDGLIFATGYRQKVPAFLSGIEHRIAFDREGRLQLSRHYAIDHGGCEIFVQNAGLHTHGVGNPELGLACWRNSCIIRELTGVEHYRIEQQIALQSFAVPRSPLFSPLQREATA